MSDQTRPQAQALPLQSVVNRVVRGLLRTPLVCRGIGSRLIIVYVTGRKSGRRYVIPVAYTRVGHDLLVGSPFAWGRNLRTGEPIDIRLKGRRRQADVAVLTSETDVTTLYATICRDNRHFAKGNKIGLDSANNPNVDDLHSAWTSGARVFRLTPR